MDFIISKEPIKNKRGEIISRTITLLNKAHPEKGLSFDAINKFYEKLIAKEKYQPDDILITAKALDNGFITLKSLKYNEKSLKYNNDDYFKSTSVNPNKKKQLLGNYYEVYFTIQTY
jgi:hypothetical protein